MTNIAQSAQVINININLSAPAVNDSLDKIEHLFGKKEETPATDIAKITEHKKHAIDLQGKLAEIYRLDNPVKAYDISSCGSWLSVQRWDDPQHTSRLQNANFCKHPLCPMCAWRRSREWAAYLTKAAEAIADKHTLYHLVLTVRNTPTITKGQLRQLKQDAAEFVRDYFGTRNYLASTEITVAKDSTYHPHLHILLALPAPLPVITCDYVAALRSAWGAVRGEPWLEAVIYPVDDTAAAALEVAKYVCKFQTPDVGHETLVALAAALHGQRKINTSGAWRSAVKAAKSALAAERDEESTRLAQHNTWLEYYRWAAGGYVLYDYDDAPHDWQEKQEDFAD